MDVSLTAMSTVAIIFKLNTRCLVNNFRKITWKQGGKGVKNNELGMKSASVHYPSFETNKQTRCSLYTPVNVDPTVNVRIDRAGNREPR